MLLTTIIYRTADYYTFLFQTKVFDSVFDYIEIWITDQNNKSLQIEDSVNPAVIIQTRTYHTDNRIRKYVQGYGFLSFAKKFRTKYGKKFINKGITAAKRFNKSKYGKPLKKEGLKFAKT